MPDLGQNFVDRDGHKHNAEHLNGRCLGLYFSASWCPPCRSFTPRLTEWYKSDSVNTETDFEIIFISSDRNQRQFDDYLSEMPWIAIPFDSPLRLTLKEEYEVKSVPTLIILDPNGDIITKDGRKRVLREPEDFPWNGNTLSRDSAAATESSSDASDGAGTNVFSKVICAGLLVAIVGVLFAYEGLPTKLSFDDIADYFVNWINPTNATMNVTNATNVTKPAA